MFDHPFALQGIPRPWGVTELSRDAKPNRLNARISDEELEAVRRAFAEFSCSKGQVAGLSAKPDSPHVLIIVNSVAHRLLVTRFFLLIPKGCPLIQANSSEYPSKSLFPQNYG
jgi:hypothetical protein